MKSPALFCSSLLCCLLAPSLLAAASTDPLAEMAGFSVFGKLALAELAKGDVKTAAGPPMNNPRYLSVQTCFVVPTAPAKVITALKQFDPTAHRELKVYLHSDLPATPTPANFARLEKASDNSAGKALAAATQKMSSDLQLSRAEAQKFSPGQPVFAFWSDLLTKRAQDFAAGGVTREAPYDHAKAAVQPSKELSGLVRQQEKINRQFGGFLGETGLINGKGSIRPELYWELLEVEDEGVLTLGASFNRPTAGGGYQAADGLYYASGGYYVALTLYQMWPIEVEGRAFTLIWRADLISASSLGELHGVERLASESAMKKDISRAVAIFKQTVGR